MTIYEFADIIDREIIITRYPNQNGRFCAHFKNCETKPFEGSGVLASEYGDGNTAAKAINEYASTISGKRLVFSAMSDNRQEYVAPKFTEPSL